MQRTPHLMHHLPDALDLLSHYRGTLGERSGIRNASLFSMPT
jgi:hypothetical protein